MSIRYVAILSVVLGGAWEQLASGAEQSPRDQKDYFVNDDNDRRGTRKTNYPDMPQAVTSFGAAPADGVLYVYGGNFGEAHHYSQAGQSGELWKLNLRDPDGWQTAATGPKLQGLALVSHGGKLYRVGGFTARNKEGEEHDLWSQNDFARFDPKAGKWESLPPLPTPRSSFDAVVAGDTLYVVGGWSMQGDKETAWSDTALGVDLTQSPLKWQTLPKPPFQRRALALAAINDQIFVIGGMQKQGGPTTKTAIYDSKEKKWSDGPALPGEAMEGFGAAACASSGRIYVSTSSGKLLRLSADRNKWEPVSKLKRGRFFHQMLPLDKGRLLTLGGANMETGRYADVDVVDLQ